MPVYKGWNAKIMYDGQTIGYVQDVSVDIDHSLEYYYEAGERLPAMIIEGEISIRGKMSRAWVDTTYLRLLNNTLELDTFDLAIEIQNKTKDGTSTAWILYLWGCKFSKGSYTVPQDGVLTEDYDFYANSFSVTTS